MFHKFLVRKTDPHACTLQSRTLQGTEQQTPVGLNQIRTSIEDALAAETQYNVWFSRSKKPMLVCTKRIG